MISKRDLVIEMDEIGKVVDLKIRKIFREDIKKVRKDLEKKKIKVGKQI